MQGNALSRTGNGTAAAERAPWQDAVSETPPPTGLNSGDWGELRSRRRKRYEMRRTLWRLSRLRRLRSCGRGTRGDHVGVHVVGQDDDARGSATGLVSCGSIWSCPVCSAHIRHVRALDVIEAARVHQEAGGGLLFLTLTLRHHRGQALEDLLGGLLDSCRAMTNGAPWVRKRDRYGIRGRIRATEVTWGEANGWHPHLHLLLFLDAPLALGDLDQLQAWLYERWSSMVARRGLGSVTREHGVRLEEVRSGEDVGQYVAKVQERSVGLEMARGDLKRGRLDRLTPFDLLEAAGDGEAWAVKAWQEYERATKGRRCIEWSRGLREHLGLDQEKSDEDIAAEDTTSEETLVATVSAEDWALICRHGLDFDVLEQAVVLGRTGVEAVVRQARHLE